MYKRKIFAEITKSELCYAVHNIAQNILYVYMYVRTHTHTHTHTSENELFPNKSIQQRQHIDVAGCRTFSNGLVVCLPWLL